MSARTGIPALGAILLAGLVLRLALVPIPGEPGDVAAFAGWTGLLLEHGTHGLYTYIEPSSRHLIDYPPGYALVLTVIAGFYATFVRDADPQQILLRALLKAPAILADLGLCVLAFGVVRRWGSPKDALLAAGIAAFSPATWLISALWGQVDSVSAVLLLLAIALMLSKRYAAGWGALTLAVLVKPQPIVVAPLLLVYQLRYAGISWSLAIGPLVAITLAYLVSLPFAPTAWPLAVLQWLLQRYQAAVALYPYTSVSAFNIYTLIGHRYAPDAQHVLGIPVQAWGALAFGAVLLGIVVLSARRIAVSRDAVAAEKTLVTGCLIVLTALFVLTTRMHERYLFSAIALVPLAWFDDPAQRPALAALVCTFTVNCAIDLFALINVQHHGVGLVILVLSALNVGSLIALTSRFAFRYRARGGVPTPGKRKEDARNHR